MVRDEHHGRILSGEVKQDFTLVKGATASGIVTDSNGLPVPGAKVGTGFSSGRRVECGEDGRFILKALPVERAVYLSAEAKGYVSGRSDPLRFKQVLSAYATTELPHHIIL